MVHCKKLFRNAAATVLTLVLVTGIASAAYGTGTVKEGPLRLRSEASTNSTVLDKASKGAKVEILEDAKDGWYKVSYNGKTGYMSAEYLKVTLTKSQPAPDPEPVPEETVPLAPAPVDETEDTGEVEVQPADAGQEIEVSVQAPEAEYARVTTAALNVRTGPGTEYERVGTVYGGSIVNVLSQFGEWVQIEYGSVKGYASCEYLTFGAKEDLISTAGQRVIDIAKQYLGTRYVYGGASPSGFDCSGFIYYVAKQAGYSVPRVGTDMWNKYPKVDRSDLQPGDIVFFTNTGGNHYITHVGLYVGNNTFIHSSSPRSGGVIYTSLSESYYATRYVGAARAFT